MNLNFADRLLAAVLEKESPCCVGLDPRLDLMPTFVHSVTHDRNSDEALTSMIRTFHELVLDSVHDLVPAVKLQVAFYEQYGIPGLRAFVETIAAAKDRGLQVIVDGKRNDIGATAEAYANAFLGGVESTIGRRDFDIDCLTVNPYLGNDSLIPFVERCIEYGKGIFVLVKTSNPGSGDIQDLIIADSGEPVFHYVARMVKELGAGAIGERGYSSIGAVVGATFKEHASSLRELIPESIFLVPGYGAQGGTASDVRPCFNEGLLGGIVNSSRDVTYVGYSKEIGRQQFCEHVRGRAETMIEDIRRILQGGN